MLFNYVITVPISPSSTEWFWSNASHIYIQMSGWDDNGCKISRWEVEYREYGNKGWKKAENRVVSKLVDKQTKTN